MGYCGRLSRMNRWNVFVLVAVAIACHGVCRSNGAAVPSARGDTENIGVRSMPDHESASMAEFKRSLNAEERDLLKRHMSKTRFIQPLVDSTLEMVNRHNKMVAAAADAVKKRNEGDESQCCSCRENTEGCYHPDDVKRSNIIRCCHKPPSAPESVAVDEREVQVDNEGQKALSELSPEDRDLLKKHLSKINNLVEAQQRPEINGNTERSENDDEVATDESEVKIDAAGQQALNSLSPEDKDLLQKYLSKIDNLVEAEHRPESNGNTDKREQADKAESNAKKDTVNAADSVIQKLYDQLEGLKQVVGDLQAQQVQKKRAEEEAESERALDELSQRFWADVHLAKEKGIKLNDLLGAMRKRASNVKRGNQN